MAGPDAVTSPYARPRQIHDPAECFFYHTMNLPGYGLVEGQWDLREGVDAYFGGVDFAGKRVLEVGTASGFLCFHMERRGAEVVAFDLSEHQPWDVVPFATADLALVHEKRHDLLRRLNNGWWLTHRVLGSAAKVVYGSVYDIPLEIGAVDVATYGVVLLHVRDPFLALANGLRLTRDTVVVTEIVGRPAPAERRATVEFVPDFRSGGPLDTWWFFTPEVIQAYVGVLGFEDSTVTFHRQRGIFGENEFFTVVAHRTNGRPEA